MTRANSVWKREEQRERGRECQTRPRWKISVELNLFFTAHFRAIEFLFIAHRQQIMARVDRKPIRLCNNIRHWPSRIVHILCEGGFRYGAYIPLRTREYVCVCVCLACVRMCASWIKSTSWWNCEQRMSSLFRFWYRTGATARFSLSNNIFLWFKIIVVKAIEKFSRIKVNI